MRANPWVVPGLCAPPRDFRESPAEFGTHWSNSIRHFVFMAELALDAEPPAAGDFVGVDRRQVRVRYLRARVQLRDWPTQGCYAAQLRGRHAAFPRRGVNRLCVGASHRDRTTGLEADAEGETADLW